MFNRLSVNALLKTVIAVLVAAVMVVLSMGALDSWTRLQSINRITGVAAASSHIFKALHNLRTDRVQTVRMMADDKTSAALSAAHLANRVAVMDGLKATHALLKDADLAGRQATVDSLDNAIKKFTALHTETAAAAARPKAERRAGLGQEYNKESGDLLDMLDKLSSQLSRSIKLADAFVDQMMEMKQLAWVVRNAAGDASVLVSSGLSAPLPPEPLLKYTAFVSKTETAWAALEEVAAGLVLPTAFNEAVDKTKREFFAGDYPQLRTDILKMLIAGEKPKMTPEQWTPLTVAKLSSVLGVAEIALDVAKDHAAAQRAIAQRGLWLQLGLLAAALAVAIGLMVLVSRRVTGPLNVIQHAMLKLAGGDLTAQVSFGARKDEIGVLANAMQTFKDSMVETGRLRAEQRDSEQHAVVQRKADMEKLADEFKVAVGGIVDAVSTASTELERAAGTLTKTAETTQQLSGVVASASEEASANVNSVASAAEEMSGSVHEIARQVQVSSKIAAEAVQQAQKTDARITDLSHAASRIGDVVKLITAIAEQTNLLALNATIEAARAGEAGRGFAIVAQEVKALAAQTAKATDEIGTQISSMQNATHESVAAIKEIGGTIGRIADIASAITVAVEQQGAATQEISRNVQRAAMGTAEVAANITDVSRGASETGSASSQVLGSAQSLARDSGRLRAEVEKFVNTVRAA
ncbi:MAG: methyl-accepting chemotaxis sensory transducer [Xanthobacteraceae bacterium]|nr:methyl-accepting chemotaxis sensory transducer [Xanthobacteraceae bacterium]